MCVPTFILGLAKESVTSLELSLKVSWHDATSACWLDARNSVWKTGRTLLRLDIAFDRLSWGRLNFIYYRQAI